MGTAVENPKDIQPRESEAGAWMTPHGLKDHWDLTTHEWKETGSVPLAHSPLQDICQYLETFGAITTSHLVSRGQGCCCSTNYNAQNGPITENQPACVSLSVSVNHSTNIWKLTLNSTPPRWNTTQPGKLVIHWQNNHTLSKPLSYHSLTKKEKERRRKRGRGRHPVSWKKLQLPQPHIYPLLLAQVSVLVK